MRSRAAVIKMYGGPDVIELVRRPVPEIGPGQVLVRVEAAAVNPVDLVTRSGALAEAGILPRRPVTGLGWDVVGVVEAAAPGPFRVGDRVAGLRDRADLSYGTHADHVVLDQSAIAPVPADADPTVAATVPLNGLTALQALDMLGLTAGQTLLVTGAAGGVGGFAVQLGVRRGLRVLATASARDEALVRRLGAEYVPRDADLAAAVRSAVTGGVDGVIDAAVVGMRALDAVRGGGAFVSLTAGRAPLPLRGTRVSNVWIRADGAQLSALLRAGLHSRVAGTVPLAKVVEAHERLEKGGVAGRLVIVP